MSFTTFLLLFLFALANAAPIKRLAGPPEDFHLHRIPNPSDVSLSEQSSTTNIWFDQHGIGDPNLIYSTMIPVDGSIEFAFTFTSPHNDNLDLQMIDPDGREVDLKNTEKEDFFPIGDDVRIPTKAYVIKNALRGKYTLNIFAREEFTEDMWDEINSSVQPNAIVTLFNDDEVRLHSSMSSYVVRAHSPVGIVAHITANELKVDVGRGGVHVDSALLEIFDPSGANSEVPMKDDGKGNDLVANDGVYAGYFIPKESGQYILQAQFKGWFDDNLSQDVNPVPFMRTTNYLLTVSSATLELDETASIVKKDDERMTLKIGVSNAKTSQPTVRAYAEVYGRSKSGSEVAVCWIGGIAPLEGDSVELELNLNWLVKAGAVGPLVLKNVYLSDMVTSFPISASTKDIEVTGDLPKIPELAIGQTISITREMLEGVNPLLNITRKFGRTRDTPTLVTLPGYCAGGNPWEKSAGDFTNTRHIKVEGNKGNDEFAQEVMAAVDDLSSFGLIGHSQGGMVSLHIHNYYFTGLEAATGGRLIQSVGTPYEGCSAAGSAASLGKIFGIGCGSNNDLSRDGAVVWLSGISAASRKDVYFYTTSYQKGKLFGDYCSLPMNTILQWPNDGTAEEIYSQLPGGNFMGNKEKWCHTTDMGYPAQYEDHDRNKEMNMNAAR